MSTKKKLLEAAAGAAGGEAVYVDDVFSTYLYTGNGANQTIHNGINLGSANAGPSYAFDGASDYLTRSSDLTGNADGKTFTFSAWVYIEAHSAGNKVIYISTNATGSDYGVYLYHDSTGDLELRAEGTSGSTCLSATVTNAFPEDTWVHVLISCDMSSASNRYIYLNDVAASVTWNTYTNNDINHTNTYHTVGSLQPVVASNYFKGQLSSLYLDYTYRDLSVEANRRLFITTDGQPASGQAALSPILYLPMSTDGQVGTNAGTGGDFTANGSPTFDENFGPYTATDAEGGLVWIKDRQNSRDHALHDTERGINRYLNSNQAYVETQSGTVASYNADGFSMSPGNAAVNGSGIDYASWSFRKQPGFFDVVKYTGNGTAGREIAHNLGSTPGMIIVKNVSTAFNWQVYHRGTDAVAPEDYYLQLDRITGRTFDTSGARWGETAPTEQAFTVGASPATNESGSEFIAYIFAHDAQDFSTDSDESIIKCGSYTSNGSSTGPVIDLGWEPQFIFIKGTSIGGTDWVMLDSMRGIVSGGDDTSLKANLSDAELTTSYLNLTSTGFQITSTNQHVNYSSGYNYVYMAIRRPHKPASEFAATDLFEMDDSPPSVGLNTGFPTDMSFAKAKNSTGDWYNSARLIQTKYLFLHSDVAEGTSAGFSYDQMDGYWNDSGSMSGYTGYGFRRAPGFFDVVTYTGDTSSSSSPFIRTIPHNLGVAPEMIIIKCRSNTGSWNVYVNGVAQMGLLDISGAFAYSQAIGTTTSTDFTLSAPFTTLNFNGRTFISYLFATVPGISKVGSYTGTGSNVDVNCGFTSGARFVLVKRTDSTGDWYVWDSERGIVAGNDPYLLLNSTAAQVTSTDYIDPLSSGFTITSSAPAALNASGGNYIFYAIA